MTIFKRIRDLREDNDLTQKELGNILNCSQRVYSDYECGKVAISVEALIKLADYYNVSLDYIVGRTDSKIVIKDNS